MCCRRAVVFALQCSSSLPHIKDLNIPGINSGNQERIIAAVSKYLKPLEVILNQPLYVNNCLFFSRTLLKRKLESSHLHPCIKSVYSNGRRVILYVHTCMYTHIKVQVQTSLHRQFIQETSGSFSSRSINVLLKKVLVVGQTCRYSCTNNIYLENFITNVLSLQDTFQFSNLALGN